jgi:hypothetical protein
MAFPSLRCVSSYYNIPHPIFFSCLTPGLGKPRDTKDNNGVPTPETEHLFGEIALAGGLFLL